jgi:hypothetical protein
MTTPPTTLDAAISFVLNIPAIAQLFQEEDRVFLEALLGSNIADLKVGGEGYRVYAAARSYLGSHPELRFVKTHDGTTIGDVDAILKELDILQAGVDNLYFAAVPLPPQEGKFVARPITTISVRGYSEP